MNILIYIYELNTVNENYNSNIKILLMRYMLFYFNLKKNKNISLWISSVNKLLIHLNHLKTSMNKIDILFIYLRKNVYPRLYKKYKYIYTY